MYYLLLYALPDEGKDVPFIEALEPEICTAFVRKQKIPEEVPVLNFLIDPACLHLDYLRSRNTFDGYVCSARFLTLLTHENVPYRAYPAQLIDIVTRDVLSRDYSFWMPEEIENTIDWEHSDVWIDPISGWKQLTRLVLTKEGEASAPLLFKVKEKRHLLVDEAIRLKCLQAEIKGVAFAPLNALFHPERGIELLEVEQQVQNHPDDWKAWHRLSDVFMLLHRYQESLDAIIHALIIEEGVSKLWYSKGNLLARLQQPQEALEAVRRATELDAQSFAWGDYSRLLRELGRTQEAVEVAKHFVQLRGDSSLAWLTLGNAYAARGDNEEALEAFEKVLSLGKGGPSTGIEKVSIPQAEVLSRLGRYEEALAVYNHRALSSSQDSEVWKAKARVLRILGRHDEEIQAEHKAQELEDRKAKNLQARPR